MDHHSLALKYRPMRFTDLVGQEQVTGPLMQAVQLGRIAPAYLFSGSRGSGKTTTARILAKALNCTNRQGVEPCNECASCVAITNGSSLDVIEIDGASNRGIDDIRDIRERVRYAPAGGGKKVYIVDEVHMLTEQAFNAFLKTLEEPPPHVVFVFATTDPNELLDTVRSRCQRYEFHRITVKTASERLRWIAEQEKLDAEEGALQFLARRAEGSLRDALVLLDQVTNSGEGRITEERVRRLLGHAGVEFYFSLAETVLERSPERALKLLSEVLDQGARETLVLSGLCEHFRSLMLARVSPSLEGLLQAPGELLARLRDQAQKFAEEDLIQLLEICLEGASKLERTPHPRFYLELLVVSLARLDSVKSLESILARLDSGAPASGPAAPRPGARTAGEGLRGAVVDSSYPPVIPVMASPPPPPPVKIAVAPGAAAEDRGAPSGVSGPVDPQLWAALRGATHESRKTLAAFLEVAEPVGYQGGALWVRVPSDFHRGQLEGRDALRFLEDKLRDLGSPVARFRCVVGAGVPGARAEAPAATAPESRAAAPAPAPEMEASPEDAAAPGTDLVDTVLKMFGGEVIPP